MRTLCRNCGHETELPFSLSIHYVCASCGYQNSAIGTPFEEAVGSDATDYDRDVVATLTRLDGDPLRIASLLREHLSLSPQIALELVRGPLPVGFTQVPAVRWHKLQVLRDALAAVGAEVELSRAPCLRQS
jgi:hypothetical protein